MCILFNKPVLSKYSIAVYYFTLLNPKSDIIVSNPPYIPQREKGLMHDNVVAHEPHLALFVEDSNPLIFYAAIAEAGKTLLKDNGMIYVEIFEELGQETQLLFEGQGFSTVLKKDMQGKDRMIKAWRKHVDRAS